MERNDGLLKALSPDEGYVIRRFCSGKSREEIAKEMEVSYYYVSRVLQQVKTKLGATHVSHSCVVYVLLGGAIDES